MNVPATSDEHPNWRRRLSMTLEELAGRPRFNDIAEIFRGGIQSIDRGQVEAARTLGMSHFQTMHKIVLPQAFRRMIPPFVNESVALLKFSSLVSVLGVADLTYQAQVLSTTTFRPIEIFTFIAIVYFVICTIMSYCARLLEIRLAASD